jgi:hypothetical protein
MFVPRNRAVEAGSIPDRDLAFSISRQSDPEALRRDLHDLPRRGGRLHQTDQTRCRFLLLDLEEDQVLEKRDQGPLFRGPAVEIVRSREGGLTDRVVVGAGVLQNSFCSVVARPSCM